MIKIKSYVFSTIRGLMFESDSGSLHYELKSLGLKRFTANRQISIPYKLLVKTMERVGYTLEQKLHNERFYYVFERSMNR